MTGCIYKEKSTGCLIARVPEMAPGLFALQEQAFFESTTGNKSAHNYISCASSISHCFGELSKATTDSMRRQMAVLQGGVDVARITSQI